MCWQAIGMKYPPEAATLPIDATSGLDCPSRQAARQMDSDARASPPGESTRSTTALTSGRSASRRSVSTTGSA